MPRASALKQHVVVAAFLHDEGEVLLAKRSRTKRIAPGKWHLPGGHVEFGEHPNDALVRELREELDVVAQVGEPIWTFSYSWDDTDTVGIVYLAEFALERRQLRWDPADLEACRWVGENDLDRYLQVDDHNYRATSAGFRWLRKAGAHSAI